MSYSPKPYPPRPQAADAICAANCKGFTVIELLGVLTVLAILIAMLVAVVGVIQRKTQQCRAEAEANALVQAVLHYRQVYSTWPGIPPDANAGVFVAGNTSLADQLARWISLTNQDGLRIALTTNANLSAIMGALQPNQNPRQMLFLTLPTNSLVNGLSDPWGKPYLLIMGFPNTGPIQLSDKICFSNLQAFAISAGAPVANPGPSNWIFSAGVRP
ncbi:MAG: type II secretion system protein [Kiritimatiellia bacterium]